MFSPSLDFISGLLMALPLLTKTKLILLRNLRSTEPAIHRHTARFQLSAGCAMGFWVRFVHK